MNKFDARLTKMKGSTMERFCGCFDRLLGQAIDLVYSGKSTDGIDFSTLPSGYCHQCDLPVNDEKIQSINQQIKLILPMFADAPVSVSASAKKAVNALVEATELPSGMLSRSEVALRLEISSSDVERHLKSGRLILDASKKFITQESFDELKMLLIRQRNEPPERF
jgi:hypothetical protein